MILLCLLGAALTALAGWELVGWHIRKHTRLGRAQAWSNESEMWKKHAAAYREDESK